MPTAQQLRGLVNDLERLVYELALRNPTPSSEQVRLLIAHRLVELGIRADPGPKARRLA